jgi:hypothetical protein
MSTEDIYSDDEIETCEFDGCDGIYFTIYIPFRYPNTPFSPYLIECEKSGHKQG